MNNETQREKWRKAFEARYDPSNLSKYGIAPLIKYSDVDVQQDWHKYVDARWDAKQESEQALKNARKQALEKVLKLAEDHQLDLNSSEYHRGWRNASLRFSKLIKELLND